MTAHQEQRMIRFLTVSTYSLIENAYPALTHMRQGFPKLSCIKVHVARSYRENKAFLKEHSGYNDFIFELWNRITEDPRADRLRIAEKRFLQKGLRVWIAIWVEVPDLQFSDEDKKILEQIFSSRP